MLPRTDRRADSKAEEGPGKGGTRQTHHTHTHTHTHTMFEKEPPEGWMAECRQEWLSRLREELPTNQAAPSDELRRKRRKAQMRLVSLGRGDVRPRPGEPASLEKIVAELDAVALRLRGSDGKFATKS